VAIAVLSHQYLEMMHGGTALKLVPPYFLAGAANAPLNRVHKYMSQCVRIADGLVHLQEKSFWIVVRCFAARVKGRKNFIDVRSSNDRVEAKRPDLPSEGLQSPQNCVPTPKRGNEDFIDFAILLGLSSQILIIVLKYR
jgi:hypothetical protein